MPRIIDQFGRKRCQKKIWFTKIEKSIRVFSKTFCSTWTVVCQKFVQCICLLHYGIFWLNLYLIHKEAATSQDFFASMRLVFDRRDFHLFWFNSNLWRHSRLLFEYQFWYWTHFYFVSDSSEVINLLFFHIHHPSSQISNLMFIYAACYKWFRSCCIIIFRKRIC